MSPGSQDREIDERGSSGFGLREEVGEALMAVAQTSSWLGHRRLLTHGPQH